MRDSRQSPVAFDDMDYRRLFFRVLYTSIYLLFYIVLFGLLLITPGDAIERSLGNSQNYNVLIVLVTYIATVVIIVFVYFLRLYITKTAIAAIPKTWVPIDKGDVKDPVHAMIRAGLQRSAVIAYNARPRELPTGPEDDQDHNHDHIPEPPTKTAAAGLGLRVPPERPVWGNIEHGGWASPYSQDLPNLQYSSVLAELPNLIEAKALTMAPTRPLQDGADSPPVIDPDAAGLLQRLPAMTLRDYLDHLTDLGVVASEADVAGEFATAYERARFSNRPISNAGFRDLMHLFAELLRSMKPLDLGYTGPEDHEGNRAGSYGWGPSETSDMDIDNDAPLDTNPPSPGSSVVSRAATDHSVRRPQLRNSSVQAWSFRTAPNTPGSKRTAAALSRQSSNNSFAQSRHPYPASASQGSSASLTSSGSSGGSVIRLAQDGEGGLPYVLGRMPSHP